MSSSGLRRLTAVGRRFTAARTIGMIIGVIGALLLGFGCSPSSPDVPELTREEVQQLQDEYARRSFQAMRTRDQELIAEIEDGPLLERDLANMELLDRLDEPKAAEEFTYPESVGYPVSSRAGHDKQQLLTTSEYSNTNENWRNLGLYVRSGPAAPWMRTFTGGMYADDIPNLPTEQPLTPIAPDAGGYAATPNAMPAIVAKALQDPESQPAKLFSASAVRQRYADDLAETEQRVSDIGTVSREYQPGSFLIAVRIDGGYLVLGSFSFTETVTARPGKSVSFDKLSRQYKQYPGKYDSTTSSFGAMFAAVVPEQGKISLVSGEERQTDLVAE